MKAPIQEPTSPASDAMPLFSVGDVVCQKGRAGSSMLGGHYWREVTITNISGPYATIQGVKSWGRKPTRAQVTLADIGAWGAKKSPENDQGDGRRDGGPTSPPS